MKVLATVWCPQEADRSADRSVQPAELLHEPRGALQCGAAPHGRDHRLGAFPPAHQHTHGVRRREGREDRVGLSGRSSGQAARHQGQEPALPLVPAAARPAQPSSSPPQRLTPPINSLEVQELLDEVPVHKLAGGGGRDVLVAEGAPLQGRQWGRILSHSFAHTK